MSLLDPQSRDFSQEAFARLYVLLHYIYTMESGYAYAHEEILAHFLKEACTEDVYIEMDAEDSFHHYWNYLHDKQAADPRGLSMDNPFNAALVQAETVRLFAAASEIGTDYGKMTLEQHMLFNSFRVPGYKIMAYTRRMAGEMEEWRESIEADMEQFPLEALAGFAEGIGDEAKGFGFTLPMLDMRGGPGWGGDSDIQ